MIPSNREPLQNPRIGDYLLKQTASTEGIASKKSLELKKRYLLGDTGSSGIMKSDSMSMLDSKFKNFRSTITDCQKLLNPGLPEKNVAAAIGTTEDQPISNLEAKSHNEEKENVYDQIVSTRNEINKTESFHEAATKVSKKVSDNEEKAVRK